MTIQTKELFDLKKPLRSSPIFAVKIGVVFTKFLKLILIALQLKISLEVIILLLITQSCLNNDNKKFCKHQPKPFVYAAILLANIGLVCKGLPWTNALAYLSGASVTKK